MRLRTLHKFGRIVFNGHKRNRHLNPLGCCHPGGVGHKDKWSAGHVWWRFYVVPGNRLIDGVASWIRRRK